MGQVSVTSYYTDQVIHIYSFLSLATRLKFGRGVEVFSYNVSLHLI